MEITKKADIKNAIDIQLPISKRSLESRNMIFKQNLTPLTMETVTEIVQTEIQPKPTIKTQYTARFFPIQAEIFTHPSKTIPDQSMSVREIMDRYARGLPLDGEKVPVYHGEDELIPDYDNMDLAERQAFKEAIAADLIVLKEKIIAEREEKAKLAPPFLEPKVETVVHDVQPATPAPISK